MDIPRLGDHHARHAWRYAQEAGRSAVKIIKRPIRPWRDEATLRALWMNPDLKTQDLLDRLGCDIGTLYRNARRFKLPHRRFSKRRTAPHPLAVKAAQLRLQGLTYAQIYARFGRGDIWRLCQAGFKILAARQQSQSAASRDGDSQSPAPEDASPSYSTGRPRGA